MLDELKSRLLPPEITPTNTINKETKTTPEVISEFKINDVQQTPESDIQKKESGHITVKLAPGTRLQVDLKTGEGIIM